MGVSMRYQASRSTGLVPRGALTLGASVWPRDALGFLRQPNLVLFLCRPRSRLGATGQSDAAPNLKLEACAVDPGADGPLFPCEKSNSIFGPELP